MADTSPAIEPTRASAHPVAQQTTISICEVSKSYGALQAVRQVSLDIQRGEIFGLIGPNGAGKSTLFKMMLGLLTPDSGQVMINGAAVQGKKFRATRRQIGYLPENIVLYDNLSGLETLQFFSKLKRADQSRCTTLLARVGLEAAMHQPMREYSKGMRQRLGFAQALIGEPGVLFLDEPTNGLDPLAIRQFYAILRELKERGVTIVITSHILAELQERVDRLAILINGQLQALGSIAALREQMQMPLKMELAFAAEHIAAAADALQYLPGIRCTTHAHGISVHCQPAMKMPVLEKILQSGSRLQNIEIRNSSLEDVFFGLTD